VLPPKTSIFESNLFWPGLLTAIAGGSLFFFGNYPELYFRIVAYYIVSVVVILFYLNAGSHRRFAALIFAAVMTTTLLSVPRLLGLFVLIFKEIPGLHRPATQDFASQFAYYFVVAALMEELMKATPALVGLCLGLVVATPKHTITRLLDKISVRTPIGGMLMGIAAGGSFTLVETLERYIPKVTLERTQMLENAASAQAGKLDPQTAEAFLRLSRLAAEKAGVNEAFLLLMPRILGSLAGHMSYAAVFGYFIGLAALRRSKVAMLLAIGWLVSSALHAAWDASAAAGVPLLLAVSSFLIFLVYFLKACAFSLVEAPVAGAADA
jgi:RsiW-degrading membrane proteinase PrsW (M82 family)